MGELILLAIVYTIICLLVALLGRNRSVGFFWSFVIALITSPIIALIVMAFSKRIN